MTGRLLLVCVLGAALAACKASVISSSADGGDDAGVAPDGGSPVSGDSGAKSDGSAGDGGSAGDAAVSDGGGPIGGDRPVTVYVPPSYSPGTPAPLVISLHGYGATGAAMNQYLPLTPMSNARGFLYAYPDGSIDSKGNHFWNATEACCDFDPTGADDSGYLSRVIEQIKARYNVDPKRVYVVGHSNGGFMSHRMACDHSDQVAAIVSISGAMYEDASKCKPPSSIAVLEIHGTNDQLIVYDGGVLAESGKAFPGAVTTANDWVTLDGCSATADTSAPPHDVDKDIFGAETTVATFASGCKPGGHVELWTVNGGPHAPNFSSTFPSDLVDFLYAHPKP